MPVSPFSRLTLAFLLLVVTLCLPGTLAQQVHGPYNHITVEAAETFPGGKLCAYVLNVTSQTLLTDFTPLDLAFHRYCLGEHEAAALALKEAAFALRQQHIAKVERRAAADTTENRILCVIVIFVIFLPFLLEVMKSCWE